MELRALWKIVKRRWWLITLPALAAGLYAAYGYLTTPEAAASYATTINFTAAQPPGAESLGYEDAELAPWLASEYVINAFTDWVRTGSFSEEVSAELESQGHAIPADVIRAHIAADNARSVMTVYLSWGNPEELEAIANAFITVLQKKNADYFPQFGEGGVEVVALDQPTITPAPPPIKSRLDPIIRFGLGLGAGIGLAFLIEYLDPTIRERKEIESLGLTVLVEIPRK